MIHDTKLFVRRLAYTPWLLVAGLLLGWAGEAVAQTLPYRFRLRVRERVKR